MNDLASLKFWLQKWKIFDHKYNKVFVFIDWNNTDELYLLIKSAKLHFLKNIFLNRNNWQKIIRVKMTLYPTLALLFK